MRNHIYITLSFIVVVMIGVSYCQTDLPSYYTFRPSGYYCPQDSSKCIKYIFTEVNSNTNTNIEVVDIIFEDSVNKTTVLSAGKNNVVVKGFWMTVMGPVRHFRVQQAYRLLTIPNTTPSGTFYFIQPSNVMCITGKQCPTKRAVDINNANKSLLITDYNINAYNQVNFFDKQWLDGRLNAELPSKAIARGTVSNGKFTINAAYVNINDPEKECPELPLAKCQGGFTTVYTRDENRCYVHDGCTKEGICSFVRPSCDTGYNLIGYPSKPNGCYKFKCDADFLPTTTFEHN